MCKKEADFVDVPEYGRGRGFLRKAAFVINVIDDLKNEPIGAGRVLVVLEDGRRPIQKEDGYFVFMDLAPGDYVVCLSGAVYQTQRLEITVDKSACPIITVRMLPAGNYPLPSGACAIMGVAGAHCPVRLTYVCRDQPLKLLGDYTEGRLIRIFSPVATVLDGRELCMEGREFFTICQTLDGDERVYLMDRALLGSYKKSLAVLSFTAQVCADEHGSFFMAVQSGVKGLSGTIDIPGQEKSKKTIELDAGQTIHMDF